MLAGGRNHLCSGRLCHEAYMQHCTSQNGGVGGILPLLTGLLWVGRCLIKQLSSCSPVSSRAREVPLGFSLQYPLFGLHASVVFNGGRGWLASFARDRPCFAAWYFAVGCMPFILASGRLMMAVDVFPLAGYEWHLRILAWLVALPSCYYLPCLRMHACYLHCLWL